MKNRRSSEPSLLCRQGPAWISWRRCCVEHENHSGDGAVQRVQSENGIMKEVPKSSCAAHGEKVRATKMNQRMVILQEWPLRKECKQNIERNENENLYKGVEECCSFLKITLATE